jgi:hypothetical protein
MSMWHILKHMAKHINMNIIKPLHIILELFCLVRLL